MSFIKRSVLLHSILAIEVFLSVARGSTELSGIIDSLTISSEGNPFIVKGNILIPSNGKMIINNGCQLFFKAATGIIVKGNLSIEGAFDAPVTFSSINDSTSPEKTAKKAKPSDWNGILVSDQAQHTVFKHFYLKYSTYGIESYNANMVIDDGIFIGNGQFNCTVGKKILPVVESISFNYNGNDKNGKRAKALPELKIDKTKWLQPSVKAAAVAGITALCFMAYFLHQETQYADLYSAASTQMERKYFYEEQNHQMQNAVISGITGCLTLSASGALLVWDHHRKKLVNISLRPAIVGENRIMATIEF
jgi:hypothetical protein